MDLTFRQLEIFRAVVVAGSITKASRRIDLSQPSISQQLAKLEEALGVQLMSRDRAGTVSLTPAGEFWYRSTMTLIDHVDVILQEHNQTFRASNLVMRLGVTPAIRGPFLSAAARISREQADFSRFEVSYELTGERLVEQLRMHKIDMAVIAAESLVNEASSFATAELWREKFLWAVPALIDDDQLRNALSRTGKRPIHPLLSQYVELDPAIPTRAATEDWYRTYLPEAVPTFRAPTFATAIEFVADGLGTANVICSLLPTLSDSVLQNVKLFQIDGFQRTAVLAMRKHLLSHPNFGRTFNRLIEYCRTDFAPAMNNRSIRPLSDILPTPARA
ncbi:LysR family transcriptional regulator [Mesobacterium pallidum]|uniref:LysR family transcriptional regulator n=1 Tax=Mesobacterium pallidum TaxID=2872037 RepID=UPI001EE1A06E|nr:LysR family transcriptional regulator [Mesobacterium pallidum]